MPNMKLKQRPWFSNRRFSSVAECLEQRTLLSSVDVTVYGMSNPWLAGQPTGYFEGYDTAGDPPAGESPSPSGGVAVSANEVLTFSATGLAGYEAGVQIGPDGDPSFPLPHSAEDGLSGITANASALVGVFLSNATPDPSVDPSSLPPSLDFTTAPLSNYTAQTFALNQPFVIGSGMVNGTVRQITVPNGATRLFMGTMDEYGWYDNPGSFNVTVTGAVSAPVIKTIGGLDPTFGANGLASHDVGFATTNGLSRDGSQSVIIGTIGTSPTESFGLTRYNGDGSLDTGFGTGGVVSTSFSGTDDVPTAVDVLSDGTILVAGTATTFVDGSAVGSEFAIAKYNADGSLDTGFGNGTGEMLVSFSGTAGVLSNDLLNAMAVGANGTIYLGGSSDAKESGNTDFAIASLTSVGGLNPLFATTGLKLQDFAGGNDQINSLALQSNGAVVAAGSATVGGAGGVTEIALTRFLANGTVDAHFGLKGLITSNVGGVYDSASSVAIQSKGGAIVIGGLTASGSDGSLSSNFVVQRYTTVGKLDRTFAGTGTVTTSFGQPSAITQIILQADGTIIASGKTTASLASVTPDTLDVALARYTTRGALDTSFNGTGKTIIDLSVGVISASDTHLVASEAFTIQPLDVSNLGQEFDAFVSSQQGVVAVTQGGEILDAGNSGTSTVEAELIAAGVDLLAKVLSTLPASVLGGLKATASISITESGTTQAIGSVTVEIQFANDAAGDGATTAKSYPEKINLKQGQIKPYKLSFNYPANLTTGGYYLVANVVNGSTLSDLNQNNNLASSSTPVTIAPPTILLVGSELSATSTFIPGKPATISLDLVNNGNVLAHGKPITIQLFLSPDQTTADGTSIISLPVPVSLLPSKPHPFKLRFTLPKTVTAGTFNLLAIIDPAKSLGSDDNTNSTVVDSTLLTVS